MIINTNRTTTVLLSFSLQIFSSLACLVDYINSPEAREQLGNPIVELPTATSIYDLTDEKEAEYQVYMGTSQTELITIEDVPYKEDCPPNDVDLSPNAVVTYEIQEDTLNMTDAMGSKVYEYSPHLGDRFWRDLPDGSIKSISFDTINGVRISNLRRYRSGGDKIDPESLCYDQYTQLNTGTEDLNDDLSNAALINQCLTSPDMYQVDFTNINDDYSNESKKVCQGDFITWIQVSTATSPSKNTS